MSSASQGTIVAVGDAARSLGDFLVSAEELPSHEAFQRIVQEGVEVLAKCPSFSGPPRVSTGLVVGYVQSGKTMSMTTVASLARDNGCQLVILLAGTKKNLLKQTAKERIRVYLHGRPDARRGWRFLDTVDSTDLVSHAPDVENHLQHFRNHGYPADRLRPYMITVMKNHHHLEALAKLLSRLSLDRVPALVIDDEADQASLNTNASSRGAGKTNRGPSTTYASISKIRDLLPHHTYLQYTATPQAPLLIRMADLLSPDFCHVLTPGEGYTGGKAFFEDHRPLVSRIPDSDLFPPNSPPESPPESLQKAMLDFLVGCVATDVRESSSVRSMLVHPSRLKDDHLAFVRFVRNVLERWRLQLEEPEDEPGFQAFVSEFRAAYDRLDLPEFAPMPEFDGLIARVRWIMDEVLVWEVNSNDGREIDWEQNQFHILVGGDKLNRGYTVRGLTVTYMPRPPGSWNADTIQQRARFLGYKASYLGLCRVYLHPQIADAYEEYVTHEEDLRCQLKRHNRRPLTEWVRSFFLDHRMRPTRTNVLRDSMLKPRHTGWFSQSSPHLDAQAVHGNRRLRSQFLEGLEFRPYSGQTRHTRTRVPLRQVLEGLLIDYQCDGGDAAPWLSMRLQLADRLHRNGDEEVEVVLIQDGEQRRRSLDAKNPYRINQLFEGGRGRDKSLRDPGAVTVQIHRLTVGSGPDAEEDVTALAIHLPDGHEAIDVQVQAEA